MHGPAWERVAWIILRQKTRGYVPFPRGLLLDCDEEMARLQRRSSSYGGTFCLEAFSSVFAALHPSVIGRILKRESHDEVSSAVCGKLPQRLTYKMIESRRWGVWNAWVHFRVRWTCTITPPRSRMSRCGCFDILITNPELPLPKAGRVRLKAEKLTGLQIWGQGRPLLQLLNEV